MIYLINQGMRQAAGWSRGCAGVGVGVEEAKLAALPSKQSSRCDLPQSSDNSGGNLQGLEGEQKRGRWVLLCRAP